jgi:hypothetical protein
VLAAYALQLGDVEPAAAWSPPDTSETAITVAPSRASSVRGDPTDVAEALDDAALLGERPAEPVARAAITITTPAPVASWRKTEPPIEIGLPVTISGTA